MITKIPSDELRLLRLLSFKEKKSISVILADAVEDFLPKELSSYKELAAEKRRLQSEKDASNYNLSSRQYRKVNRYIDKIDDFYMIYKITENTTGLSFIGATKGLSVQDIKSFLDPDDSIGFISVFLDSEITDWTFQILAFTGKFEEVEKKKKYYIKKHNTRVMGFNHD